MPLLPSPPTVDREGGGGGVTTLPGCDSKYGQVNLSHHGRELFLCHCGGDGLMMQGGSNGDG
jgi:hypothetical protein